MAPLPKDAPVMIAWERYKGGSDYQNTRNWALHDAHVDGSLWAAFLAGFTATTRPEASPPERTEELVERLFGEFGVFRMARAGWAASNSRDKVREVSETEVQLRAALQSLGYAEMERERARLREALVALADGADACAQAPNYIVQPFLGIYRKHGNTIAEARTALRGDREQPGEDNHA
jgi:hypothetical protein